MDNEDISLVYVALFAVCLLVLLFTSYNFIPNNLPALIIILGIMLLTGITMMHALKSI